MKTIAVTVFAQATPPVSCGAEENPVGPQDFDDALTMALEDRFPSSDPISTLRDFWPRIDGRPVSLAGRAAV
ncbi:MAG TPA: hypothetical protein VM689_04550 [Aliidongia sp.]|nr:hypothetical protein [Aliidongia sp.]